MPAGNQRFTKEKRLRSRAEFLGMGRKGRRAATEHFLIQWRPNGLSFNRLGLTVSRRVGQAVTRNLLKRRLREAFRKASPQWPQGVDLVVIARPGAAALDQAQLARELEQGVRAIGQRLRTRPPA